MTPVMIGLHVSVYVTVEELGRAYLQLQAKHVLGDIGLIERIAAEVLDAGLDRRSSLQAAAGDRRQEGAFPDYIQARIDAALGGRDE